MFVDDGSTDGSLSVLSRLHDEMTNVVVVHLRRNFGKAAALQAGFLEARGDFIVTIDADLQDDPAEIPKMLAKLDEGFDLVSGWKTRRNDPFCDVSSPVSSTGRPAPSPACICTTSTAG